MATSNFQFSQTPHKYVDIASPQSIEQGSNKTLYLQGHKVMLKGGQFGHFNVQELDIDVDELHIGKGSLHLLKDAKINIKARQIVYEPGVSEDLKKVFQDAYNTIVKNSSSSQLATAHLTVTQEIGAGAPAIDKNQPLHSAIKTDFEIPEPSKTVDEVLKNVNDMTAEEVLEALENPHEDENEEPLTPEQAQQKKLKQNVVKANALKTLENKETDPTKKAVYHEQAVEALVENLEEDFDNFIKMATLADVETAREAVEKFVERCQDPVRQAEALVVQAQLLGFPRWNKARKAEAKKVLEEATQKDNSNRDAQFELAIIYLAETDNSEKNKGKEKIKELVDAGYDRALPFLIRELNQEVRDESAPKTVKNELEDIVKNFNLFNKINLDADLAAVKGGKYSPCLNPLMLWVLKNDTFKKAQGGNVAQAQPLENLFKAKIAPKLNAAKHLINSDPLAALFAEANYTNNEALMKACIDLAKKLFNLNLDIQQAADLRHFLAPKEDEIKEIKICLEEISKHVSKQNLKTEDADKVEVKEGVDIQNAAGGAAEAGAERIAAQEIKNSPEGKLLQAYWDTVSEIEDNRGYTKDLYILSQEFINTIENQFNQYETASALKIALESKASKDFIVLHSNLHRALSLEVDKQRAINNRITAIETSAKRIKDNQDNKHLGATIAEAIQLLNDISSNRKKRFDNTKALEQHALSLETTLDSIIKKSTSEYAAYLNTDPEAKVIDDLKQIVKSKKSSSSEKKAANKFVTEINSNVPNSLDSAKIWLQIVKSKPILDELKQSKIEFEAMGADIRSRLNNKKGTIPIYSQEEEKFTDAPLDRYAATVKTMEQLMRIIEANTSPGFILINTYMNPIKKEIQTLLQDPMNQASSDFLTQLSNKAQEGINNNHELQSLQDISMMIQGVLRDLSFDLYQHSKVSVLNSLNEYTQGETGTEFASVKKEAETIAGSLKNDGKNLNVSFTKSLRLAEAKLKLLEDNIAFARTLKKEIEDTLNAPNITIPNDIKTAAQGALKDFKTQKISLNTLIDEIMAGPYMQLARATGKLAPTKEDQAKKLLEQLDNEGSMGVEGIGGTTGGGTMNGFDDADADLNNLLNEIGNPINPEADDLDLDKLLKDVKPVNNDKEETESSVLNNIMGDDWDDFI